MERYKPSPAASRGPKDWRLCTSVELRGGALLSLEAFFFLSELFQLALIPKQYGSFKTIFIHSHHLTL